MANVRIVEVGPRDGLQNISNIVRTDTKIELIQRLARSGLSTIEATSFVSPKWIPQLADGQQVLAGIRPLMEARKGLIQFPVLVPNVKGLDLACRSGAKEVAVFVSATEGFSRKNINCSVDESLVRVRTVAERAKSLGVRMRGYVSCIFSDPYEGPTKPSQVVKVTQALLDAGCYEVSLGDTLGVGTPGDVETLLKEILKTIPANRLAGHFHDTYGQAVANVVKSYELGLRTFDSSVAGLGGCPFAKGAKGNLATEDLVYTLERMGIRTGVKLDELVTTGVWISEQLQIPNGSRAGAALAAKTLSNSSPAAPAIALAARTPQSAPSAAPTLSWTTIESTPEYSVYRSGASVKIHLTRPRNGNALTLPMIRALTQLFKRFSVDESIFRIVISAEGKYFCTGMDLKNTGTSKEMFSGLRDLFDTIDSSPKTTIAAINGPCLGGGVGLAFVCDIRIATSAAVFKLSEVRLGLCAATISKYIIREWGVSFARAAMLTARDVRPSELAALQVIHKVVPDKDALDAEVTALLRDLRFAAPRGSALSKELVRAAWTDAGGREQTRVIERSFDEMMREGSESKIALRKFAEGIKGVDWELLSQRDFKSKL